MPLSPPPQRYFCKHRYLTVSCSYIVKFERGLGKVPQYGNINGVFHDRNRSVPLRRRPCAQRCTAGARHMHGHARACTGRAGQRLPIAQEGCAAQRRDGPVVRHCAQRFRVVPATVGSLATHALTCPHMFSQVPVLPRSESMTCSSHMFFSHVLTCSHMSSHVLTCSHMFSHVLTCSRTLPQRVSD